MSTRRLLARLDRLEKMPKPTVLPGDFRIDPALAKALRDDQLRVAELRHSRGEDSAPSEEEALLLARIDRMADTIVCPPSYGAWQARKDATLLYYPTVLASYSPALAPNDAVKAQLAARVAAFDRTPEARARCRIGELLEKQMYRIPHGLEAADQSELDHLRSLYPDLPWDPDNLLDQIGIRMEESARKRALEAEARKHAQEDEPD
jgi:hypothetical protein